MEGCGGRACSAARLCRVAAKESKSSEAAAAAPDSPSAAYRAPTAAVLPDADTEAVPPPPPPPPPPTKVRHARWIAVAATESGLADFAVAAAAASLAR